MAAYGHLRASDADREQVIDVLKVAFTQGRLTMNELERRTGRALTSRTYAELGAVTADIPAEPADAPPRRYPARPRDQSAVGRRHPPRRRARPRARRRGDWGEPPPLNEKALRWGLAAGTIALAAMIAAALVTGDKDLFGGTVVSLIAYCLAWLVLVSDNLASRLENQARTERKAP